MGADWSQMIARAADVFEIVSPFVAIFVGIGIGLWLLDWLIDKARRPEAHGYDSGPPPKKQGRIMRHPPGDREQK